MAKKKTSKASCPNPTGKGGFADHPENRSDGHWDKNNSFSYWMNFFKQLGTKQFLSWEKDNPEHTMAASLAYAHVFKARFDLKEFEVVANRTEGMPKSSLELSGPDRSPITITDMEALKKIYGDSNTKTGKNGKASGSSA